MAYARRRRQPRKRMARRKSYKKTTYRKKKAASGKTYSKSISDATPIASLYTKSRMPARKRKAWTNFKRKVQSVEADTRGKIEVIVNGGNVYQLFQAIQPELGYRPQVIDEINLYSKNAAIFGGNDQDLILNEALSQRQRYYEDANEVRFDNDRTFTEVSRNSVQMLYARLDVTYTNQSNLPMELDLYVLTHRMPKLEIPLAGNTDFQSLEEAQDLYSEQVEFNQKLTYRLGNGTSTGLPLTLEQQGVTPFQCRGIQKLAGATVIKKHRVFLKAGESIMRSYKDPKRRWLHAHAVNDRMRYDANTTTYLTIARPLAIIQETETQALFVQYTKSYAWTIPGMQTPITTYFNNNDNNKASDEIGGT